MYRTAIMFAVVTERAANAGYVVVGGPTAAGKTTCAEGLGQALPSIVVGEPYEDNPYLSEVFGRGRGAFDSQRWFLNAFADLQHSGQSQSDRGWVVQDHSIYDAHEVFDRVMYRRSWLTRDQYERLDQLYRGRLPHLRPPDVVVWVCASADVLLERIRTRGRELERSIDLPLLEELVLASEEWWANWKGGPVVRLDTGTMDLRTGAGIDAVRGQVVEAALRAGLS